jgi:class 3 adenylate cyclase
VLRHAFFLQDGERLRAVSDEVLRLGGVVDWVTVHAWAMRGLSFIWSDPQLADEAFENGRRVARQAGIATDQGIWASWYGMLIGRAADKDEINVVLEQWRADHNESRQHPCPELIAMLALFGDVGTAVELDREAPACTPARSRSVQFARILISAAQGDLDLMRRQLVEHVAFCRETGQPHSQPAALTGFAKLAFEAGDFEEASRLLATVRTAPRPFRNMMDEVVYVQLVEALRNRLDAATRKRCRAEGSAKTVGDALAAQSAVGGTSNDEDIARSTVSRRFSALLFTDIVASTEGVRVIGDKAWSDVIGAHNRMVRTCVTRHGGREVDNRGDGFVAVFSAPGDAVASALEAVRTVETLGITIRAGVHAGECEHVDGEVNGIAVHAAARVMSSAGSGQVLVSPVVRNAMLGGELNFESNGFHQLKGIEEPWELFAVSTGTV